MSSNLWATHDVSLGLELRRGQDGPLLVRKNVGFADLADHRSEVWHHSHLRHGFPGVALEDVAFRLLARRGQQADEVLTGFALETINPAGKPFRCEFNLESLAHLAACTARQLVASGALQPRDVYSYRLVALDDIPGFQSTSERGVEAGVTVVSACASQLRYRLAPLAPLLSASSDVGPREDGWPPVFYYKAALRKAETFSRRGGNQQPPVETGAMLAGCLGSCPQTGEFYLVIVDALEALDTQANQRSLHYSGPTWARLQAILRARQLQPQTAAQRFVGQAHGHPFLLDGGAPPCAICLERPDLACARTSCFVSMDDRNWTCAVFAHQPWQLCHIFGLNARGECVNKLFGLRNGQLLERGFRVISDVEIDSSIGAGTSV